LPTPSDPTAIQPKTYEEMARAAEERLAEEARQVEECRGGVKHGHAVTIPHDTGSEYGETEPNDSESSSRTSKPAGCVPTGIAGA
jgi:hypothetical protein